MSALTDTFTAIANAIRGKLGVQTTYTPTQMSSAIASIPTEKPEQTKSVTATTTAQTVNPDTGKVLSSVTVNPQVHSATYTPTGYSNANDMGAQNNYRYVDTSGYEPTSVTPSDTSPVSVSSGSIIKPSSAGYLVETVSNLGGTPDKTFQNNSAGSSGSVDITVTKKPRYIILSAWARTSAYRGMVGIIDVAKNQAYQMGYSNGAIERAWTDYTTYFPTISSTKVTYDYAGFAGNSRVQILIYY